MKPKELRTLTQAELEQRLRESREELFNLRFQQKTGQLGNPLRIREIRKDIARLMTVLEEMGGTAPVDGATAATDAAASGQAGVE